MVEIWKDIEGYEGYYQVSNLGRVKSLDRVITYADGRVNPTRGKVLKQSNKRGYHQVVLQKDGKRKYLSVHRLVAQAFVHNPDPEKLIEVNHKDEVKNNNVYTNLEWCTIEYNNTYGSRIAKTSKSRRNKGGRAVIGTNVETGEEIFFPSMGEAQRNGFHRSNIYAVCQGKGRTFKGYYWRYANGEEGEIGT